VSTVRYSRLDRWFHHLALGSATVRRLSFDLDRRLVLRDGVAEVVGGPVYICGLARSGTTLLLRLLSRHTAFRSLSYRAMPFVLAPNLWRRLSGGGHRPSLAVERVQGDGLVVDTDSVEAFEEVFWRTFDPGLDEAGSCYGPGTPDAAIHTFAQYRSMVVHPRPRGATPPPRYLSKNNNNLVRLSALCADGAATVLMMYRDPIMTARSLHRQHLKFSAPAHPFVQDYMRWLGHREFGPGHLPFCFASPHMAAGLDPSEPDYWLDYWTAVYRHVLAQWGSRLRLIDYDALCRSPQDSLMRIFAALDEHADIEALACDVRTAPQAAPPIEFSAGLVMAAREAHAALTGNAANVLVGT
jgi:hypothetical protein